MRAITPACLVKIVNGAIDYAQSFDFSPHPDYRHAAMLLEGIDPADCHQAFTFGRDGKPFYMQGPHESPAQVEAIMDRITSVGGHFMIGGPASPLSDLDDGGIEDELDEPGELEDDSLAK